MATIITDAKSTLYPVMRTRDNARNLARIMRSHGITPTTPARGENGWHVAPKHNGGTLTINRHK